MWTVLISLRKVIFTFREDGLYKGSQSDSSEKNNVQREIDENWSASWSLGMKGNLTAMYKII